MNMFDRAGWLSRIGMNGGGRRRASVRFPAAEITWKCSQRTIWIATHATEFLGTVEELDGTYIANDTARGTYNTYRTHSEAMEAFEDRPEGDSFREVG